MLRVRCFRCADILSLCGCVLLVISIVYLRRVVGMIMGMLCIKRVCILMSVKKQMLSNCKINIPNTTVWIYNSQGFWESGAITSPSRLSPSEYSDIFSWVGHRERMNLGMCQKGTGTHMCIYIDFKVSLFHFDPRHDLGGLVQGWESAF